jgi:hypothetical protein
MEHIYKIKTCKPRDVFKLIDELKIAFNDYVLTVWSGSKKTSILTVKIDVNKDIALISVIRDLKTNTPLWNRLDVYTNKEK